MYEYILKNKLKRIYRKKSREKHFLNWKDIHTILVLFDTSNLDEVTVFIDQLKKSGKKVTTYAYLKKENQPIASTTGNYIISEKEAGRLFNNPLRTIVKELKKETFDAVIDLSLSPNIFLEYLLAQTQASVKTGLKKTDSPQYDLAITTLLYGESDSYQIRELSKQIVYYLNKISAG